MFLLKTPKELYEKYEYLVPITVGKNFSNSSYREAHMLELDEILQFGRIGLYEACKSYDDSKGKSFRNYAIDRIIWKVKVEAKRNSLRAVSPYSNDLLDSISLNTMVSDSMGDECYLQDILEDERDDIKEAQVSFDLKKIKEEFSENVYKIITMRMKDYTYEEIADELGFSKQHAQNLISKNRGKISELLNLKRDET